MHYIVYLAEKQFVHRGLQQEITEISITLVLTAVFKKPSDKQQLIRQFFENVRNKKTIITLCLRITVSLSLSTTMVYIFKNSYNYKHLF